MRAHLDELIDSAEFTRRHTAPTDDDRRHMLAVIGEESLDSLLSHTVPDTIRLADALDLDEPRSPQSVLDDLRHLAAQNVPRTSLIGMGYYGTITPPVIVRNVLESPAWYTAYTPYQPEISQGRLEALLNFQTMVAELTGFDLANASSSTRPPRPPKR
jgi:glycine dehydrogenase